MKKQFLQRGDHDIIDVLLYPQVGKLAKYIPRFITPNQLTITGFLFGLASSFVLLFYHNAYAYLLSALFIFTWWLFDSFDGVHARLTNQMSNFGGFLDHFSDVTSDVLFMFALLLRFDAFSPLFVFLIMFRSGLCSLFFLSITHTHQWYLPLFGPVFEKFVFAFALIFYFCLEWNMPLYEWVKDVAWASYLQTLGLANINIIKLIFLSYLIILPINWVAIFYKTKNWIKYTSH